MVGHHSTGESSRHKLVSVVEAFDTVMKESKIVSFEVIGWAFALKSMIDLLLVGMWFGYSVDMYCSIGLTVF